MKRVAKIILSLGFVFVIGLGIYVNDQKDVPEEKQVHAEEQLIMTPMNYEEWAAHRVKLGYPVTITKSEWIERGYHQ